MPGAICDDIVLRVYADRGLDPAEREAVERSCKGTEAGGYDYYRAVGIYYSRDTDSRMTGEKAEQLHDAAAFFHSATIKGFGDPLLIKGGFYQLFDQYFGPPSPAKAAQFAKYSGNPTSAAAKQAFSAAQGWDADAMFAYAIRMHRGEGVTRSEEAVNFWLKEAAHKRHAKAQAAYAWRVYRGIAMEQSHKKAHYWADLSAKQGDPGGYLMRGLLAWPHSSPKLFLQMLASNGLAGVFNFSDAMADLDRAEVACRSEPFASDPGYEGICAQVPLARSEVVRSLQSAGNPSDEDYRRQSQGIIDDYNANEQRIADNINNAYAVGLIR
ncbi:tetratricopeptide repeat protein [Erythrobacter sp. SD-21]|uniref:tetratricopeptide repeat protein n=1 Tax=Erythrobacter sp. SD-21 TaxID=161528 RepID=UPI000153EEB1|nr:sel1 repeat family protein [Erythrobacter sp. SD-21]EDL47981.1 hypothetical protein ED21_25582 [Erythrobacter sp. SD-21]